MLIDTEGGEEADKYLLHGILRIRLILDVEMAIPQKNRIVFPHKGFDCIIVPVFHAANQQEVAVHGLPPLLFVF